MEIIDPKKVPDWLKPGSTATATQLERLKEVSGNWLIVNRNKAQLTEIDILRILCIEIAGHKRPTIINRLRNYYNTIRKERELKELWEHVPNAGTYGKPRGPRYFA